jgi:GH25 family lysozyme M1 (1,4-beta-N-acetylmuramidase)
MARDKVHAVHKVHGVDVYEVTERYQWCKVRMTRRVFRFIQGEYPYTAYVCHSLEDATEVLESITGATV